MRLPILDRIVPVEHNSQRGLAWLEAAKSLHACGLVISSDVEGWSSPGKLVEAALSRWFAKRTDGVAAIELDISFATATDLVDDGAIEEPGEDDLTDLAVWVEVSRDRPNFRSLRRGFLEMEGIAEGLGIAATTILSAAGHAIGFTFDHDYVSHFAGMYIYGWEDCWPDGGYDPSDYEPENEDGSSEYFAYTRPAFQRNCPRRELLWHPSIRDMEKFVLGVAKRNAVMPPLLEDLVRLVKARRHRNAMWPTLGGTDYNSMCPVFSLAWEAPGEETDGIRENIYRVWDDFANMLYNGAEGWTYGLGAEMLSCRSPALLRETLKRWDGRLRLLRATDRLLQSMTDPVTYGR
ncbi:hypothetical protein [Paraburkholderia humisilvae]|uniref:Uncharacterized protein n=2 Tax=Paraburkholderia humisilvae TaxID=627669 RepID=A0A6J5DKI8_9BURK|nr:hypothetical protein [Paraburkholderia humisilvae]CAB3754699.1 hypothetical protein LMG29542_02427 [Paraburkholderia humisilvae]